MIECAFYHRLRYIMLTIIKKTLLATAALFCLSQTALAATAATFTPEQKKAIEAIIHDYLVTNPAVLIEATQALQVQQQKDMVTRAESAIKAHSNDLFNNANSPTIGNAKGGVTMIEVFDYQCHVCQEMDQPIQALIKENNDLRVVMKQWPIFGKMSTYAAKAALASAKQGKFGEFYAALMVGASKSRLSQEQIISIAKSVGLNTEQLTKDMEDPAYDQELKNNLKLAEAMRLAGTPAFIIAKTPQGVYAGAKAYFVPGGASEATLEGLIKKARSGA